jgi:hypothetical protein
VKEKFHLLPRDAVNAATTRIGDDFAVDMWHAAPVAAMRPVVNDSSTMNPDGVTVD